MSEKTFLEVYFLKLRHDKKYHLGLGDVRLTIAMQEEIVSSLSKETSLLRQIAANLLALSQYDDFFVDGDEYASRKYNETINLSREWNEKYKTEKDDEDANL